ncbi:hypothetical protein [Micromonospora sp. NPDC005806]|uniref:DUF4760 domain-containing protein n=1 Tax=Micromonospora sp. NPDC005806 TaxID=3364234 RepID=UPI003682F324
MDSDQASINLVAIIISIAALGISSFLTLRQATLARQANQISVFVDLLSEVRSADFRRREQAVWQNLPQHTAASGFDQLPDEDRVNAEVVCSYYSALAYCIAIGVLDHDLAVAPIRSRLIATWEAVHPFVTGERERADHGYFSLLEDFVTQAKKTDIRRAEERLSRRAFPDLRPIRRPSRTLRLSWPGVRADPPGAGPATGRGDGDGSGAAVVDTGV